MVKDCLRWMFQNLLNKHAAVNVLRKNETRNCTRGALVQCDGRKEFVPMINFTRRL